MEASPSGKPPPKGKDAPDPRPPKPKRKKKRNKPTGWSDADDRKRKNRDKAKTAKLARNGNDTIVDGTAFASASTTTLSGSSSAGAATKAAAKSRGKGKGKGKARSVGGRRRPSTPPEASSAASCSAASSAADLKRRIRDRKNTLFNAAVGSGGSKVTEVTKLLAPYLCPEDQRPEDADGIVFPARVDYEGVLMLEHLIVKEGRNPRLSTAKAKKKAQKLIASPHGAMFCDPAGSGKTAVIWMFLTLLKRRNCKAEKPLMEGLVNEERPVLLIAPGSEGDVRDQWYAEYLLVHPDGPEGEGKRKMAVGELNLCWIDTEMFDAEPDNDFLDSDPGGNVKKSDVYLLSEARFSRERGDQEKIMSWIKAKGFELVIIDEAHGCGTTKNGKPSTLAERVRSLYTKLPSVQILLISSDPGWEQTGNEDLFRKAIGLTGVHTLENRVVQRPLADFTMPKIETSWFPIIEATQEEYDRIIMKKAPKGSARPNQNELATTLPFDIQAKLLADQVVKDSTKQWAMWAIPAHENKVQLREMLVERGIKCSEIYNDRGDNAITPEAFATAIQQDKTLQVIFPPRSHERGINLYTNVQNCVFWDESDAQWTTEDRRSQIESRHARRNTVHKMVNRWRFQFAPNHPHQVLLNVRTRKKGGKLILLGPHRDKAMAELYNKLAKLAAAVAGPAAFSSAASSAAAAVPGPAETAAAAPTASAASGKRKRSIGEFPEVRDFLRTANPSLEEYYDDLIGAGFESLEDIQSLTDDDLQDDVRMTKKGHRKRLLRLAAARSAA